MKVSVLSPITHGEKLHLAGEEVVLEKSVAERLIEAGVVKEATEAKTPAKSETPKES